MKYKHEDFLILYGHSKKSLDRLYKMVLEEAPLILIDNERKILKRRIRKMCRSANKIAMRKSLKESAKIDIVLYRVRVFFLDKYINWKVNREIANENE